MTNVVLVGDIDTGHPPFPPTPVMTGSGTVLLDGKALARIGDPLMIHAAPPIPPHPRAVAAGSSSVLVEGVPVARTGDLVSCGGVLIGSGTAVSG